MSPNRKNNHIQVIERGKSITQVGGDYVRRSVFNLNLVFILVSVIAIASAFYFDIEDIKFPIKLPFVEFNFSQE